MTDDEIERLYAVNLRHIFSVTRAMIPLLRKKGAGGSIVSVSSIEGFRAIPNGAVYAAFKAGVTGFAKSLAVELAPEGIRVNLDRAGDHRHAAGRDLEDDRARASRAYQELDPDGPLRHPRGYGRRYPVPGEPARRLDHGHFRSTSTAARWPRPAGTVTSTAPGRTCR